jgi:uncharacterized Zn finger protein
MKYKEILLDGKIICPICKETPLALVLDETKSLRLQCGECGKVEELSLFHILDIQ